MFAQNILKEGLYFEEMNYFSKCLRYLTVILWKIYYATFLSIYID